MNSPRWFSIAVGLLLLNAVAVVTTGWWRHAAADEQPRDPARDTAHISPALNDSASEHAAGSGSQGSGATVSPEPTTAKLKKVDPKSPLDAIPIPESLPEIPSLADLESLQNDPGFQEFRRLFAKEEASWDTAPPPLGRRGASTTSRTAYYAALEQRLETVEKLCSAARSIAREAAIQSQRGSTDQSQELIHMTTQLRDIAAKLLVSEL